MKRSAGGSMLLRDEMTGDWVIVAPGRRHRPDGHRVRWTDVFSPRNLKDQRIIASYERDGFPITAIENNFPVFTDDGGVRGRQEILVEGARVTSFAEFTAAQIAAVLDIYADRAKAFRKDRKLKFMVLFKNEGVDSGASQPHPHSQIFAMSFVPTRVVRTGKRNLHRLALKEATPARTIYKDKHVVAFANPSGRFAYEVRIVPKRHFDNITQASSAERFSFAKALHRLLPLIKHRKLAFNYFFHDIFADTHEPFEIRFAPRGSRWGGFELDAGVFVNPVPAEAAAAEYRSVR